MKNLCFAISLLGILSLLFFINFQQQETTKINSITEKQLNKQIKITGEITLVKIHENNFTVLTVKDNTGEIDAICNCPNIKKSQQLEIVGKVTQYNNDLQINIDKIKLFKPT